MRILFLSPDCPWPATNGMRMRTGSVLRALAECGHEIAFFGFTRDPAALSPPAELRALCRSARLFPQPARSLSSSRDWGRRLRACLDFTPYSAARFASAEARAQILTALAVGRFDAVVADSVYAAVNLPEALPAPLVINTHNLEHLILRRFAARAWQPAARCYAGWEWRRLRAWEQAICRRAALVLACSEHDRDLIARLAPATPVAVVPNVAALPAAPRPGSEQAGTILYCGGLDWYPNRDAVLYFARHILPRVRRAVPGARFWIAGREGPQSFARRLASFPGVCYLGPVPEMQPVIAAASVVVVPLRIGSGTRLKILEAAAMGKAIVSTPLGAEGLEFTDCKDILLAERPAEFADNIAFLLRAPLPREILGRAARRTFERLYTQAAATEALRRAWALEPATRGGSRPTRVA